MFKEYLHMILIRVCHLNKCLDQNGQTLLISRVCLLSQCLVQNVRFQGLRSQIKRSLLFVNEHLSGKRNAENGHSGQTLLFKGFDRFTNYLNRFEDLFFSYD